MTYVDLATLKTEPLTQVISLGPDCSVAYNLRRYFDFDAAMPFDWWIVFSEGLTGLLRNFDAEFLYDPAMLERKEDRSTVRHRTLDIFLHHEFPREWRQPKQPVVDNFLDFIGTPKARTAYLMKRFLSKNQKGERILFVREDSWDVWSPEALTGLFPEATWSYAAIPKIPRAGFDWHADPVAWDQALSELGVTLDPTHHRPFKDRGAQHAEEDFSA